MSRMPEHDDPDREVSFGCKVARGSKPAIARTDADFIKRDRQAPREFAAVSRTSYFLRAPLRAHAPPMPAQFLRAFLCPLHSFFAQSERNRERIGDRFWRPTMFASSVPFF